VAPGPRPGTLESFADARPAEPVLLTPDGALTRAEWEARAEALAEHLAGERDVALGDLLTVAGRIGPDWLTASWAAAKLGAGLAGLPPGPVVDLPDAVHVGADELAAVAGSAGSPRRADAELCHEAAPRRLSGTEAPPDSVTFSRLGRPVRRSFPPASVAAIGATLADLVARVQAIPGTTLVVAGPVSDLVATFVANVVLVGGGRIVTAPEPTAALALAADHGAELAAFSPGELDVLAGLTGAEREALDLTSIRALVTGGAQSAARACALVDDLFGADAVIDVYATADTGMVAVRSAGAPHHVLLDGVAVRTKANGVLEIRSPLAAAPGWVATGDRAALVGDAGLELR